MMKSTVVLCALVAASLTACTTTQRQEVRNDREHLHDKQRDLLAAERDGSFKDVRKARENVREARRELRSDQKELYRPGREGVMVVALRSGDLDPGNLYAVPQAYRSQYQDGDGSYYRFDGQRVYQLDVSSRIVTGVYPVGRN